MELLGRFLNYVSFETTSDEESETCPSTEGQKVLGAEVVKDLINIGIKDAHMDEHGYVYGAIPANCDRDIPTYGLIAHMDTAPDASGKDIKARVTEPYEGGDILLNEEKKIYLSPKDYPALNGFIGKHLIVTDGTTLLGADDKAGLAEIVTACEEIIKSDKPHGTIRVGFTPDEEIGRGADLFDVKGFGADYAYTVDGGRLGEIEFENFNAASCTVRINGKSIHPGDAKGKMINASLVAMEFNSLLPEKETPFYTEGYEGFYHVTAMSGACENATIHYIIRDHSMEKFIERKETVKKIASTLNVKYGEGTVEIEVKDSYYNMREKIEPCMFLIDQAMDALRELGVEPKAAPIRGGTDGARLSFEGLPCPNLCTGGENYHGRFEYAVLEDMETVKEMLKLMMWNVAK